MFYEPRKKNHGMKHDPFKACVAPRPIGWITSLDAKGNVNLAPFSFFNAVSAPMPMVMFSCSSRPRYGLKDSGANCEATKEFVVNIANWDLRVAMNESSASVPPGTDEMKMVGLEPEPSVMVKPPRVKDAPIHLECVYYKTVDLPEGPRPGERNVMILGEVVGININDNVLTDGRVDIKKVKPIARLGYMDFCTVGEVFEMLRPD
jgi:flavin reductase (DIM6/NTAB) family NADH-FMN oxidoreductase RutF